jgi:hypothetical protein
METPGESRQRALAKSSEMDVTRRTTASAVDLQDHGDAGFEVGEANAPPSNSAATTQARHGSTDDQVVKGGQRMIKGWLSNKSAQTRATADMAVVNFKKVQVL